MNDHALTLLTEWTPFSFDLKTMKENREQNGGKLMMKGILQKAETLNQNGRVYPQDILEREVRNYQKFIRENRALGECVDAETTIHTKRGWVSIVDVKEGDIVFTLNLETNKIEEQPVLHKTETFYEGKMLHFMNGESLDMMLTPDHKFLLWDRKNLPNYLPASKVADLASDRSSWLSHSYLRYDGDWSVDNDETTLMPAKNSQPMNIVSEQVATISLDTRFLKIDKVDYKDWVYCVTTQNGNWLARRKGKAFWTGNCDHPDSSVVELKKVSHIIREAHMEGNICYGTVEILDTPCGKILQSLVEAGVTLGISSRGVGSTRKSGDTQIVQDDFQLICWDFVSEPSTPGAFMMREGRQIKSSELAKTFNRSDRIDRIFNDILNWKK